MIEIAKMKFKQREKRPKYQVRFWSNKRKYEQFKARCEKKGMVIQDVFNQFMEQF